VRGLAMQQNNNLFVTNKSDLGFCVVDPVKLRQILLNLLSNACKLTENGEIELICERLTRDDGREWISIAVRDTGIGSRASELAGVLKAFSQADPSARRKYGGTGLGLALSQRLASMMGGLISLGSEENVGSTFTLLLPADLQEDDPRWDDINPS